MGNNEFGLPFDYKPSNVQRKQLSYTDKSNLNENYANITDPYAIDSIRGKDNKFSLGLADDLVKMLEELNAVVDFGKGNNFLNTENGKNNRYEFYDGNDTAIAMNNENSTFNFREGNNRFFSQKSLNNTYDLGAGDNEVYLAQDNGSKMTFLDGKNRVNVRSSEGSNITLGNGDNFFGADWYSKDLNVTFGNGHNTAYLFNGASNTLQAGSGNDKFNISYENNANIHFGDGQNRAFSNANSGSQYTYGNDKDKLYTIADTASEYHLAGGDDTAQAKLGGYTKIYGEEGNDSIKFQNSNAVYDEETGEFIYSYGLNKGYGGAGEDRIDFIDENAGYAYGEDANDHLIAQDSIMKVMSGGIGNDTIDFTSSDSTMSGHRREIVDMVGADSQILGEEGQDIINIKGGYRENVLGGTDLDTINLLDSEQISVTSDDADSIIARNNKSNKYSFKQGVSQVEFENEQDFNVEILAGATITGKFSSAQGVIKSESGTNTIDFTGGNHGITFDPTSMSKNILNFHAYNAGNINLSDGENEVNISDTRTTGNWDDKTNKLTIKGGAGNSIIHNNDMSGKYNLDILGGSGNEDIYIGAKAGGSVNGGDGDDKIVTQASGVATDSNGNPISNNNILGGAGNDDILTKGAQGIEILDGGAGNDKIQITEYTRIATGSKLIGGDGDDVITFDDKSSFDGTILGGSGVDHIKLGKNVTGLLDTGNDGDTVDISAYLTAPNIVTLKPFSLDNNNDIVINNNGKDLVIKNYSTLNVVSNGQTYQKSITDMKDLLKNKSQEWKLF